MEPKCQWLPWDEENMDKGEQYGVLCQPFDILAWVEWNPEQSTWVCTVSGEAFDPAPDYYLDGIPELPRCAIKAVFK